VGFAVPSILLLAGGDVKVPVDGGSVKLLAGVSFALDDGAVVSVDLEVGARVRGSVC